MSLLPSPVREQLHLQDQDYPYDMEQYSSFTINKAVSDTSHFKFGRNDLDRPSEVMLRGQVYWRPSISWCQPMSKISVGIPTLYKPVQLQLKIVTTNDCNKTDENETWVGFYLSVEDICTLKNWENWAYLNLNIRTPFQEKRAKYVQYSPSNNCWGWSKFFRVSTMMACKGNPFIIDIEVEHNPVPLFLRLPCLSLSTPKDHPSNFNDDWKIMSKLQTSNIQDLLVLVDNDKGDMSDVSLHDETVMKEDSEEPVVAIVVPVPVPVVPSDSDNSSVINRTKFVSSINNVSASSSKGTIIQPQPQTQTQQQHLQKSSFGGGKNANYKRRSRNSVGGVRRGYSTHNNSNSDRNRDNNISISQHSTTMIFSNRSRPHASSAHGNFTQGQSQSQNQNQNQGTSSGELSSSNGHQYHNYNGTHSHSHRRKVRSAV